MRIGSVAAGCSVAVLAALALAACVGGGSSGDASAQPGASGSGKVAELRSLERLKAAFAADEGRARVVLLVSPT